MKKLAVILFSLLTSSFIYAQGYGTGSNMGTGSCPNNNPNQGTNNTINTTPYYSTTPKPPPPPSNDSLGHGGNTGGIGTDNSH